MAVAAPATLRPAEEADRDFLFELYASTREPELALVDWDDAVKRAFLEHQFSAQDTHYRAHYPGASFDVVELEGERVGRLYVHRGARDIRIMDIAVVPAHRNRGIGTGLVGALIEEARLDGRVVSIHVEVDNPARSLYERLGFVPAGEHGIYLLMECSTA